MTAGSPAVPGRPAADPSVPPGWDYNPSEWPHRLPVAGMAMLGFVIAAYLAAFQLGWINEVWEPFFGEGSRRILTSPVSRLLPVSDAALGALGYLADAVSAVIGGTQRWRRMPWTVVVFGLLVGPLGAISILLVVLQPVLYNTFCTLCMITALISVLMIGPAMDEFLSSLQALRRVRDRGGSVWRAFWQGEERA